MKFIITALVLLKSIPANLCAQSNDKSEQAFKVPDNIVMNRRFYIDLDKGNKLIIELTDINDLQKVINMDSLLGIFVHDILPLKDSVSDPLTAKRIDYITDAQGRKKIRFQQYQPKGASFLVTEGELASLRTEQDTINIIGVIPDALKAEQKISLTNPRYYHLTFYLNDISELAGYMNGTLNDKLKALGENINTKWPLILGTSSRFLKADKSISADKAKGFTTIGPGDYIEGTGSVNVQNYKNYFVPSFSLGVKFVLSNRDKTFKREPGLFWEPHFIFNRDAQGKLRTYRNDFLTLTYAQGGIKEHDPRKDFSFVTDISLGYLIHREGEYFEKNTFRLGVGKLKVSKISIEPSVYFNNIFKGITPGIRVSF